MDTPEHRQRLAASLIWGEECREFNAQMSQHGTVFNSRTASYTCFSTGEEIRGLEVFIVIYKPNGEVKWEWVHSQTRAGLQRCADSVSK